MTYLQFLLAFLVPPIVMLGIWQRLKGSRPARAVYAPIGVIAAIALVYTTPWDNYLIAIGAWTYPPDVVIGTIGLVPIEEYCFFILQPLATGLLFEVMRSKTEILSRTRAFSVLGTVAGVGLTIIGAVALFTGYSVYLGLILVWSGPVVVLQWVYNGALLERRFASWFPPLVVSTAYLWIADATAIRLGIWSISDTQTSGLEVYGLPIEEMVFFLLTNAMVLFGLILLEGSGIMSRNAESIDHELE